MGETLKVIGKGLYGVAEAARLLRRPTQRVRRWANGYTYPRKYGEGESAPILQTGRQDQEAISFNELMELHFVREFSNLDVPLQRIRLAAARLSAKYGPYPFSQQKLFVDGKRLVEVAEEGFFSADTGQIVADFAVDFARELEFREGHVALLRPKEGDGRVVIDPTRALGEPILEEFGTPTRTLFRAFLKERHIDRVATFFELPPDVVRDAVEFEQRFSDAA